MDRRRTHGRVLGALVAAAIAVTGLAVPTQVSAQQARDGAGDDRQAIVLPEKGRAAVLKEMRQMLTALNGVLTALAAGDRAAVAEAARSGGTRIAVDRASGMAAQLPEAFMRLGMSTHRGFDAVAVAAESGVSRDSLLGRLGTLTAKCVSCHAGYRLEAAGEGSP